MRARREEWAKTMGRVVRKLRVERGLSQERLAEVSNIDRTYASQLERGLRLPSIEYIEKLAIGLGMRPHELLIAVEKEVPVLKPGDH